MGRWLLLVSLACAASCGGDDPARELSEKVCKAYRLCDGLDDSEYEECLDDEAADYDELSASEKKEADEIVADCSEYSDCDFVNCLWGIPVCDESCDGICNDFGTCVDCVETTDCEPTQECHRSECRERCAEDTDCDSGTCDIVYEVCGDSLGASCSTSDFSSFDECFGLSGCIDVDADLATVEPYCTDSCNPDIRPCPEGYTCVSDECRKGGPGDPPSEQSLCEMTCDGICDSIGNCMECMTAADCGPTQDCAIDDTCRERCSADTDCVDTVCFGGTCGDPIGKACDVTDLLSCLGTSCTDVDATLTTVPGYCTDFCSEGFKECPAGYACIGNDCLKM